MLKLGQPRDFQGQPTWQESEIEYALNKAYDSACRKLVAMDRDYQSVFEDVSIPAGTVEYQLPVRTRFLRKAMFVNSNGTAGYRIRRASSDEMGFYGPNEAALLRPDRNSLTFTIPTSSVMTVRLYYGVYYVPLLHGCARSGSGGVTMPIAEYSSIEDDLYNGLDIRLVAGTGIGQERSVSDYNGATQVVTVSLAWTVVPDDTTRYTSRPDLPWEMKEFFENLVLATLTEKLDESEAVKYRGLAAASLLEAKEAIKEAERREPDFTFDVCNNGGWGDPGDPSYSTY